MEFKIGDLVKHISNYFVWMVIVDINSTGITCSWVTNDGRAFQREFQLYELQDIG